MSKYLSLFLRVSLFPLSHAWHSCNSNFSSVDDALWCPDGNTCCPSSPSGGWWCISGKNRGGHCCHHVADGSKGCGSQYRCLPSLCERIENTTTEIPFRLPQYHLCPAAKTEATKSYITPSGAAYLSSHGDLLKQSLPSTIDTAWIVVHGSGHNADDYLCGAQGTLLAMEEDTGRKHTNTTVILTPWFLPAYEESSSSRKQHRSSDLQQGLRWLEHGPIAHTWRYGANAVNSTVSSYAVVDELVQMVLDQQIQHVVVAGHSAGGQVVQRWSLLTPHTTPFRAVVGNPKSLCWLDSRRYCTLETTSSSNTTKTGSVLRIPDADAIAICPTYNEWEWGWEASRPNHREGGRPLIAPYVDQMIATAGGVDAIVQRFADRNVVYLAGELDLLWNGDCEARMQGDCRLRRSENFFKSLREIYGRQVHRRFVVSGVHHDHCLMFQSPEGRFALFGDLEKDEEDHSAVKS